MPAKKNFPTSAELARLQESVLKAILTGQPLAGEDEPLRFPDLSFVLREGKLFLSEENLAAGVELDDLPVAITVVSPETLQTEAGDGEDIAYLRFAAPESVGGALRLTLEGKLMSGARSPHALGLSSLQIKFRKVGGAWRQDGDTVSLAS